MNPEIIDLRHNYPVLSNQKSLLTEVFLGKNDFPERGLQMSPAEGKIEDRMLAAEWLSIEGYKVSADQVFIGLGGHHGCLVAVLAAGLSGKTIAVEEYTYAGFKHLAKMMNINLIPVKMDENGIIPGELERICKQETLSALYFMPTVHNPLGSVIPMQRRNEIVNIARNNKLALIEDDAYGFLHEQPIPNFAMLAPERTYFIHSFSKPFAPGLKVAYIIAPVEKAKDIIAALNVTASNSAPLLTEICSILIKDGTMKKVIIDKRKEGSRRQAIAQSILPMLDFKAHPNSWHLWAELPRGINADAFASLAIEKGVDINSSSSFLVPGSKPVQAIRLGLGGTQNETQMIKGLEILRSLF